MGGVERHFTPEAFRTPVDCQAIFLTPHADIGRPTNASPTKLGSGRGLYRLVDAVVAQQGSDGSGHLGRQRHDGGVGMRPRQQAPQPLTDPRVALCKVGIAARAPWVSILRRYLLPRLVIPRRRGRPPVVT